METRPAPTAPVLFEDVGWFAVAKPPGVLVIPGRSEEHGPSLREALERQRGRKVFTVHRLDRDTSGALVFALDAAAHRALSMAFEEGRVEKQYLALVDGQLTEPADVTVPLSPARRGRMRPARPGEEGKEVRTARTLIRPLQVFPRCTLVEATPLTGRTHQIRVHLLSLGHPLLFDHQYGRARPVTAADLGLSGSAPDEVLLSRTPLHARRVRLPSFPGSEPRMVEAPLAADMAQVLDRLHAQGCTLKTFDNPT